MSFNGQTNRMCCDKRQSIWTYPSRTHMTFFLTVAIASCLSCGQGAVVTTIPEDHAKLKAIVTLYAYACRELGRPPQTISDLEVMFEKASIENPQDFLRSTRDGMPYVIIWGLDLEKEFLGSEKPLAYERAGKDGSRLMVNCDQMVSEITSQAMSTIEWPPGYSPEF